MNKNEMILYLWSKMSGNNIVRLFNIEKEYRLDFELYAKVENQNLTGSIKDKTALQMIEDALNAGIINDETVFVEPTSGNTGISIAYIASYLGLSSLIIMPNSMSVERRNKIKQFGGNLLLVQGGMKECVEKAKELANNNKNYLILSQFTNQSNPKAHYLHTAKEINQSIKDLDYIFAGIGTGGTISGIAQFYKEKKLHTRIIGIEPLESPLLTKGVFGPHLIQGIGANFIPETLCIKNIDGIVDVPSDDSINMAKEIRNKESLDIGISSGAALLGAIKYLKQNKAKKVLIIFPDKGDRYTW